MDSMSKTKLNFYCPTDTVEIIDRMAEADHRDRTSMLNKMIDFYLSHNPNPEPATTNGAKRTATPRTAKKKAGVR
jgi:hypothetical protein